MTTANVNLVFPPFLFHISSSRVLICRIGDLRGPGVRGPESGRRFAGAQQADVGAVAEAPGKSLHQRQTKHDERFKLGRLFRAHPTQERRGNSRSYHGHQSKIFLLSALSNGKIKLLT